MKRSSGQRLLWFPPALFLTLFFLLPLARVLIQGLTSNAWHEVATTKTLTILWFTLWQSLLSASASVVLGIPTAYLFYKKNFAGVKHLRALIATSFVLPSIVVAIAIRALIPGASGALYILLGNIFMNYALATRMIGTHWQVLDRDCDEAAELDGASRLRHIWSISLPQLRPSLASAFLLTTLYCISNFGIVMTLGSVHNRTLESEIYRSAVENLDLSRSSALVLLQVALTVGILITSQAIMRRNLTSHGSIRHTTRISLKDLPVSITAGVICLVLTGIPMGALFLKAFHSTQGWGLHNFSLLTSSNTASLLNITVLQSAENSIRNAIIVILFAMGLGTLVSYLLVRTPKVDIFFQLPLGISSVIVGFGFLITFTDGFFPLRSSWLILPIAQILLIIPMVIRFVLPALLTINSELIESAEIDRADEEMIWWKVQLPLIKPALAIAAGYAAITSIGDFGATDFLAYGDQATLPIALFQLISRPGAANYGAAMAASSLLVLICGAVIYISEW